ncbi:hypothetical protein BKA67DRAFT_538283 [Truncatella angustata]|uniref:C2H2-type domain-containing protein n=1 Tax=Truncatella angustata TaxID=152316 RepID=A0A9P8ZSA4_9PEZI|nr:uncharacterized protein BKA67DRAFT_538283 [Truncatella angustata]KAH6648230.1 hypothetical protein BKA67DRAFT_538283 [Truncatella angustata]
MEDYPSEYLMHLACPFPRHEPEKHQFFRGSCTEGWGFESLRLLMEHLRHDHSLDFGCPVCKERFRDKRHAKTHKDSSCEAKNLAANKPVWMSQAQNREFVKLNFNKSKVSVETAWDMICVALWGRNHKAEIPGMYHVPGFFQSRLIYCSNARDPHLDRQFRQVQRLTGADISLPETLMDASFSGGSIYSNKPLTALASSKPSTLDSGIGMGEDADERKNTTQGGTSAETAYPPSPGLYLPRMNGSPPLDDTGFHSLGYSNQAVLSLPYDKDLWL